MVTVHPQPWTREVMKKEGVGAPTSGNIFFKKRAAVVVAAPFTAFLTHLQTFENVGR